jgi:hypothetical protein
VFAAALGGSLLLGPLLVAAADPLWIQPSTSWQVPFAKRAAQVPSLSILMMLTDHHRLGIDGNWSTFQFLVGSPPQYVNLLPSTTLSEIWVVEDSGCSDSTWSFQRLCFRLRAVA